MAGSSQLVPHIIRFAVFEADLRAGELRKSGSRIRMQEQPFQILAMLLECPGEVVTREEIRQRLWSQDIFVDFEHGVNSAVARLREALNDSADNPRYIETIPRRGYRFIAPVNGAALAHPELPSNGNGTAVAPTAMAPATVAIPETPESVDSVPAVSDWGRWITVTVTIAVGVVLTVLLFASYFHFHHTRKLTETDSLVLADFANSTADPVFDSALRPALEIELSESPYLSIVAEQRMRDTLRFMGRPPDERLTASTAREICQRLGSKAMLSGQISQLADQYFIVLEVSNCATGDSIARVGVQTSSKGDALRALDKAATTIRQKLGESLSSIQKYDVPIEQATTPSLEALKAFSFGQAARYRGAEPESIPFLQRAIDLDPNFAMAYAVLGQVYANMDESVKASEYTRKAFEQRDRASDQEKFYISTHYYENVTYETDKAVETYQLWEQSYPRDTVPRINLSLLYQILGHPDKALAEAREAARIDPSNVFAVEALMVSYGSVGRLEEAKSIYDDAIARGLNGVSLHIVRYELAFLENDDASMQQQAAWAAGKPEATTALLAVIAQTQAFHGQLRSAEDSFRRARDTALRDGKKETAATLQALAALIEAELDHPALARRFIKESHAIATSRDAEILAALTLARAGDPSGAEKLVAELTKEFPSDTLLNNMWFPTVRAEIEVSRGNANGAVRLLESASPYELGLSHSAPLLATFVRGEAYLRAHDGKSAGTEFQKVLDHPAPVGCFVHGALANLDLGRAYALAGDMAKARAAYQNFFALWKDADPDIPILKQAKAEYAKLQ